MLRTSGNNFGSTKSTFSISKPALANPQTPSSVHLPKLPILAAEATYAKKTSNTEEKTTAEENTADAIDAKEACNTEEETTAEKNIAEATDGEEIRNTEEVITVQESTANAKEKRNTKEETIN